jgi:hypothetical protein
MSFRARRTRRRDWRRAKTGRARRVRELPVEAQPSALPVANWDVSAEDL